MDVCFTKNHSVFSHPHCVYNSSHVRILGQVPSETAIQNISFADVHYDALPDREKKPENARSKYHGKVVGVAEHIYGHGLSFLAVLCGSPFITICHYIACFSEQVALRNWTLHVLHASP